MSNAGGGSVVAGSDAGVTTKLPPVAAMTNVVATLNDDSVSIAFDPVDGALDYRVYPLPSDNDITVAAGGGVTVHNAVYRCAGTRETPAPNVDNAMNTGSWVGTKVDQQMVGGYLRTLTNAKIGYVYTQPGPGLVPVYALGEAAPNADDDCSFARWAASRVKKYTTSETERTQMLGAFARDDGIAFYVPTKADNTTIQIYIGEDQPGMKFASRYYFPDGPEATARKSKTPAFLALANQAPGTVPLMRVYYANSCGWSHDELAAGQERFNRIYKQGDALPSWSLLWSGVTAPTTLVVEALDSACPYQGHLSPQQVAAVTAHFGNTTLLHEPYISLDAARAASPTGEVFINGQHGPAWTWDPSAASDAGTTPLSGASSNLPKAVARAFINVAPKPPPTMDFFAGFSTKSTPETFTTIPCGSPDGNCYQTWRQQSPTFDQMFINAESGMTQGSGLFAFGQVLGQWWVTYADVAADTNGKYRLTAKQKGTMSESTFLHVTMEVNAYSTDRRYPQILISDQDAPVQYALVKGHTVVVQPRAETTGWASWPLDYQLQVCNLRTWDVNDQCPMYDLYHVKDMTGTTTHLAPNEEIGEHATEDDRVLIDVYASTKRTYLFLNGQPYACANMPAVGVPNGPVTVTWGDVLYHSAVEHDFAFHSAHLQIDTQRHFDNLGFSSGVAVPSWDETRLPCTAAITP
jgi:hypothetical protein